MHTDGWQFVSNRFDSPKILTWQESESQLKNFGRGTRRDSSSCQWLRSESLHRTAWQKLYTCPTWPGRIGPRGYMDSMPLPEVQHSRKRPFTSIFPSSSLIFHVTKPTQPVEPFSMLDFIICFYGFITFSLCNWMFEHGVQWYNNPIWQKCAAISECSECLAIWLTAFNLDNLVRSVNMDSGDSSESSESQARCGIRDIA